MAINSQNYNGPSPFERLVGAVQGVTGTIKNIGDLQSSSMQRKLAEDSAKPDSEVSKGARDFISTQTGITIPENTSANMLKDFATYVSSKNDREFQRELNAGKYAHEEKLANMKANENPAKKAFQQLPEENQKQIEVLAGKIGTKQSIKNQLDSTLEVLRSPDIPEDQKITSGRTLLKILNSAEGADAVGAEEAKRLGSFLEYKMGNFTQPGSFIGRDLDKFIEQVDLNSKALGQALERGKSDIDTLYGRSPRKIKQIPTKSSQGPKGPIVVQNGHVFNWNPQTGQYE